MITIITLYHFNNGQDFVLLQIWMLKNPSFNPKAEKRRKNYTTLRKAKKRLKKHTNNSLPLNNEGTQNQCFFFIL